ncbi:MAG: apolipoprotein N-acyltransferase [Rhodospirillales bacterium]
MKRSAVTARELSGGARLGGTVAGAVGRLHAATVAVSGWRRVLVAVALGVLAVSALPPVHLWPALVPAFVGLLWLCEGRRGWRGAMLTGWLFGFGYFTAGLYWIANALLTKPEQFGWLAPVAVLGLAALQAIFPAAAAALTHRVAAGGVARVLVFAAAWTGFEWVRSWAFSGFPWNLIGTVWTFSDTMVQISAFVGTYGLGLITVAAAAMPAVLADPAAGPRRRWAAVGCGFAALAAVWTAGLVRLDGAAAVETVPGVQLRLVQPSIPQRQKWQRELLDRHLARHLELGATAGVSAPAPTHVIWGETAAPLFLAGDAQRRAIIAEFTPRDGLTITGTLRGTPPGEPFRVWNSLQAVDADGAVVATYDKSHLVPFGEYVPFRSVLGIDKVTAGTTDFSRGPGTTTLRLPGLPPVAPLICYEVIFPARVVDRGDRPEWMLNLTNDAWYGRSSGPYQHFAAARMRAVEEGLPLVRVANNGVSAIVDPYGRVVGRLGLDVEGVVDGPLPRPLAQPTVYARTGNGPILAVVLAMLALGAMVARRR